MRILIVDDNQLYAIALRDRLHALEPAFEVACAYSTYEAREAVKGAVAPFDVLLLDQHLDGSDVDGITLMQELLAISPSSNAIIVTVFDDAESGLRAFEQGAHRFINKPFDTRELVYILKALNQARGIRTERDWLQILSEIANDMQNAAGVAAVAGVIARGGLRFGFRRARLWLYGDDQTDAADPELVGVSEAGHSPSAEIGQVRRPLSRMIYSRAALQSGRPRFFVGRELGPGGADDHFGPRNVLPPAGDWVEIPILNEERGIGTLALDNGDAPPFYEPQRRKLLTETLGLFGKQSGLALERARLHDKLKHQAEEAKILSEIGRRVTASAAQGDLTVLLDDLRGQLRDATGMDVTNFMVVLLDEESNYLDFRRQYEEDEACPRHWRKHPEGLCSKVIRDSRPLLLPHGSDAYRREHHLELFGRESKSWLGAPLIIDGKAIGAIVVQDYENKDTYTEQHSRLLSQVVGQVGGAIYAAYRLERAKEEQRQTSATDTLLKKLPQFIRRSVDSFWHALLTTITHQDGFSLNRAVLFRFDEAGDRLVGRMAIGQFLCEEARLVWEEDARNQHQLQDYFEKPYLALDRPTPLQQRVQDWVLAVDDGDSPCHQIWTDLTRRIIPSTALTGCLPDELLNPPDRPPELPGFECGLLPLKLRDRAYGLVVVDNFTDGEPLRPADLDRLENLLARAGEIWDQYRETAQVKALGDDFEKILTVSRLILAGASSRPLRESLRMLCHEARQITRADSVVIYPYHSLHGGYDLDSVVFEGLRHPEQFKADKKNKPRQRGVSFAISQSGTLAVPDVSGSELSFGGRPLVEHDFVQREQIKALIGIPMRQEDTGESLGVVYLNYWSPQRFIESDIVRAEHVAQIGATCISYLREMERGKRTAREVEEQWHQRDMQLLSNISTLAQAPDTDEKKIILAILQNTTNLFNRSAKVTLGLLDWRSVGEERVRVRRDYALGSTRHLSSRKHDNPDQGLLGTALHQNGPHREGNYLTCPILLGPKPIGALLLQKLSGMEAFTAAQEETIAQVAAVATSALDNVRTREYLQTVYQTMSKVSDPTGLEDTLQGVIDRARQVAPDIDCVTLWYENAEERERLIAGPPWGVWPDPQGGTALKTNRVVREVMRRRNPLFASVAERERCLRGKFLETQGIASVAALPLSFGDNPRPFGALFFNYRQAHEFTPIERTLFPFFANAAAAAIHDAQAIELAEKRRKRLETAIEIANSAGARPQMDEGLRAILTTLRDRLSPDTTAVRSPYIMLYNDYERLLTLHPVMNEFYRPAPGYEGRESLSLDDSGISTYAARKALKEGQTVIINVPDVHSGSDKFEYVETDAQTKSEICAGLVKDDRLLGVLVIKSTYPAAFNKEDEKLFGVAARQVAATLDLMESSDKSYRQSLLTTAFAWAGELAHEINSTVGAVLSLTYWLRESEPNLSNQGNAWTKEIDDLIRPLAYTTTTHTNPEAFSLEGMLMEEIGLWHEKNAPNVRIHAEPDGSVPSMVYADRGLTWRAVRHLLVNAVEAMMEDRTPSPRIEWRTRPSGSNQVELQVEDFGPGIRDEVRQHLFRERWTSKGNKERGLGLLTALGLIESMNGGIYLHPNSSERGALFTIRLPLANHASEEGVNVRG